MGEGSYTFVDLFSGAGGFTEGILLAGGADRRFRLSWPATSMKMLAQPIKIGSRRNLGSTTAF